VNGGAAEVIPIPLHGIKTCFQELCLHLLRKLPESNGGGIGKRTPETLNGLESYIVINKNSRIIFVGLFQRFKSTETCILKQLTGRLGCNEYMCLLEIPFALKSCQDRMLESFEHQRAFSW
jgi:hypothetical protein